MITAKFFYESNHVKVFEISGHAESGPYGYDLVCAGVSAIVFGSFNAIKQLCNIEMEVIQGSSGYLHVTLPKTILEEEQAKVQLLLEALIVSLETVEREYSQFIKLIKEF